MLVGSSVMDFCVVDQPLCACNIYSEKLSLEVKAHVSSFYKKTNAGELWGCLESLAVTHKGIWVMALSPLYTTTILYARAYNTYVIYIPIAIHQVDFGAFLDVEHQSEDPVLSPLAAL